MKDEYLTKNSDETEKVGYNLGKTLKGGDVVVLRGDLGAGKTVFTKGIARSLGIKERITSPTYAYMNDYGGKLYHYDCYRIENIEQAENLGLAEYFYLTGVCVIEWAENIKELLPETLITVTIEKTGEQTRKIIIKK